MFSSSCRFSKTLACFLCLTTVRGLRCVFLRRLVRSCEHGYEVLFRVVWGMICLLDLGRYISNGFQVLIGLPCPNHPAPIFVGAV